MESGQRLDTPPARMGRAHLGAEEWQRVRSRSSPELAPPREGGVQKLAKKKGRARETGEKAGGQ